MSARLSPTAIHHLLLKTGTTAIIVSPRLQSTAKKGLSLFSSVEDAPVLCSQISYDFFVGPNHDGRSVEEDICAPGHYISETDRSVLILHSSGTTGLPKPIYTSHRHLLCFTVCHDFASKEEAEGLNVSTLPLYHVSLITCDHTYPQITWYLLRIWISHSTTVTGYWQDILSPTSVYHFDRRLYRSAVEGYKGHFTDVCPIDLGRSLSVVRQQRNGGVGSSAVCRFRWRTSQA